MKQLLLQYRGLSKAAYILFIGKIVTHMGAFIWPLMTLILTKKIGLSATESAWTLISISIFYLVGGIVGGKLADRYNRKKIIIVFDIISTLLFIGCALMEPGIPMIVLFGVAGLFASMEGPAYDALTADATKSAEREKVYSLGYLGHNIGYMVGAAVGGMLFHNYLHLAFLFDGLTTFASTLLIILFIVPIPRESLKEEEINEYEDNAEHSLSTVDLLKERPPLFLYMFSVILSSFVYSQWGFSIPLYMVDLFGEETGAAYYGFVSSFNAFVVIAFTPIMTYLLRKYFGLQKAMLGVGLFSVSYALIFGQPPYPLFYVMMFLFTLGEIVNVLGSSPYVSRRVPSSHRGRIAAIMGIGHGFGNTLSRLINGMLIDYYSYALSFTVTIFVGMLAVILLAFILRMDRRYFPKLYLSVDAVADFHKK